MRDGTYTIIHGGHGNLPGQPIGSFCVVDGKIKDRTGLAEEVLDDGPVTSVTEFRINRLNNGYNWVKWERPVQHEPRHSLEPEEYE